MNNQKHTTIRHVAEKAGVSIQTVSRVLNDRPDVSPETRLRVQTIIADMGYKPFASARGLASKRTRSLGLIATDFSDYFFSQVIIGANEEALNRGYFFLLGSTSCCMEEEPKYLNLLSERHVDGVLFVRAGSEDDREHIATLQESGIPIVTTGYYQPNISSSMVDVDNVKGGYLATKHLIDNGHTQIAMITGPQGVKSTLDRTQGYLNALASAGITPISDLIGYGNWHHSSGYQAMRDILGRGQPFTAVFSHNDRMAIGAISVLRQAELRVPEDISIVGYDDIPEAEFAHPPLTTIHQPMIEVGKEAARILIELIENPAAKPQQVCLDTELIPRASVNCRF